MMICLRNQLPLKQGLRRCNGFEIRAIQTPTKTRIKNCDSHSGQPQKANNKKIIARGQLANDQSAY